MILHAQYVFKSVLLPHLVINSMGRLAEIPCHDSLHRPSVTARSLQIFCHLILCPNSSHFYSQASFHFHRILYLPWEEENITKTIQHYIFRKPKKDGRTSNHQCNLRRIDKVLLLRMRLPQHQRCLQKEGSLEIAQSTAFLWEIRKLRLRKWEAAQRPHRLEEGAREENSKCSHHSNSAILSD